MNLGNVFRWKYNAAIIDQMFCYIVLVYCIGLLYWSIVRVFCRDFVPAYNAFIARMVCMYRFLLSSGRALN